MKCSRVQGNGDQVIVFCNMTNHNMRNKAVQLSLMRCGKKLRRGKEKEKRQIEVWNEHIKICSEDIDDESAQD